MPGMRADKLQEAFGEVLRDRRRQCGLSQEALALSAEVDRTFVSQIERGIRQPALGTLWKLAEALDTRPSELLAGVERALK